MVVRTGLRTTVGNLLRQVMCPVHTAEPHKDTFVVVSCFQHSLPISLAWGLSGNPTSCMIAAAFLTITTNNNNTTTNNNKINNSNDFQLLMS